MLPEENSMPSLTMQLPSVEAAGKIALAKCKFFTFLHFTSAILPAASTDGSYIVKDGIEFSSGNILPLWWFGLNY